MDQAQLTARRNGMNHVLRAVAAAPWANEVVLRGSALLPAWLGDAAREPEDLDFVVLPPPQSADVVPRMVDQLITQVRRHPGGEGLCHDSVDVRYHLGMDYLDPPWQEGIPDGRRITWPYLVDGTQAGVVQVDLAFDEPLPVPPVKTRLPSLDRPILTT